MSLVVAPPVIVPVAPRPPMVSAAVDRFSMRSLPLSLLARILSFKLVLLLMSMTS